MNNENYKIGLEQIYNFICEFPGFSSKSNLEKINIFCRNIHDKFQKNTNNDNLSEKMILLVNGKEIILNLLDAPKFMNKDMFINWIVSKTYK